MKYILALLNISVMVIISSCDVNQQNNRPFKGGVSLKSDSVIILETEALIKKYSEKHFKSSIKQIVAEDTSAIECFYENKNVKILKLKTFLVNEESQIDSFTEMFYFGENNGFPIIYTYNISSTHEISRQVITENRQVVSYLLKNEQLSHLSKLDSIAKESKISALMFLIVQNITHFGGLNYKIIEPSIKSMPVFINLKPLPLYTDHDFNSKIVKQINSGEHLYFLNFNRAKDFGGNDVVWYKTATEDKKTEGWIIGNETNIKYYTDGD